MQKAVQMIRKEIQVLLMSLQHHKVTLITYQ